MALEDLTPEQLEIVQSTLLSPPPQPLARESSLLPPELMAAAGPKFLNASNRFFDTMMQLQERKRISDLAQRATSLTGLEPDFMQRKQQLAQADPEAFAKSSVQQALSLADARNEELRKRSEEVAAARLMSSIYSSQPSEIAKFQRSGRPEALKYRETIDKALQAGAERETRLSELPDNLREQYMDRTLPEVESALTKYRNSLPPMLRKLPRNDQLALVDAASRLKAQQQKEIEAGFVGRKIPKEGLDSDRIRDEISSYFFKDDSGKTVSDATIDSILKARAMIESGMSDKEMFDKALESIANDR